MQPPNPTSAATRRPAHPPWLVFPRPNPQARLRLFCFPYAGGGATVYRTWPAELPPDVEVCAIQPPGRESRLREKPFERLQPLIEDLGPVLLPYLNMPFVFFGHSLGALVCFEIARYLRRRGMALPEHLFVSGRPAPHLPLPRPPIHALPKQEFVTELQSYNGTPAEVLQHEELMELLIPILRADFAVNETYAYTLEAPLACPMSVFGGLKDSITDEETLDAWREHTMGPFVRRMFPGDHFYLNAGRTLLLQVLSAELNNILNHLPPRHP